MNVVDSSARANDATIWTQDNDFVGLEKVRYIERR